jgi:hypothetical protein
MRPLHQGKFLRVGKPSKPADFGQLRMTGGGKSVADSGETQSHGGNEQQDNSYKMDDHAGQKMWCMRRHGTADTDNRRATQLKDTSVTARCFFMVL